MSEKKSIDDNIQPEPAAVTENSGSGSSVTDAGTASVKNSTSTKSTSAKKTASAKSTSSAKKSTAAKSDAPAKSSSSAKSSTAAKKSTSAKSTSSAKSTAAKSTGTGRKTATKATAKDAASTALVKDKTDTAVATLSGSGKSKDEKIKVLFVSSECVPFLASGGLGEVAGSLPKALNNTEDSGIECRVIMPLYAGISGEWRRKMTYIGNKFIPLAWRSLYMGLFRLEHEGTIYYFVDNEYYFNRAGLYGYYDDCERFAFFSRAVLEAIDMMDGFQPDILHANDWQTALVPVYQEAIYKRLYTKTVFTIHNVEYQGHFGKDVLDNVIGLPGGYNYLLEYKGDVNLMKGGIEASHAFTTVSPTYAEELKYAENAFGMDEIIRRNEHKYSGIINGIDTVSYDPETDVTLPAHYNKDDISGKATVKKALQEELGLAADSGAMLMTVISRLVPPKGIDLLCHTMDNLLYNENIQFILLGTGNRDYEDFFKGLEYRHPGRARCLIKFDGALARKLYAGADVFVMPSRSEACGLAQMIAMRYGTVPLVHRTGGLNDTVADCSLGNGNGFVFDSFTDDAFADAVRRAEGVFSDKGSWESLIKYDMGLNYGWSESAKKYTELYKSIYTR